MSRFATLDKRSLTPSLSAWPLRGHTALKSILWETLFLDQFHKFSLLSLNSFLQLLYKLLILFARSAEINLEEKKKNNIKWPHSALPTAYIISDPDSVGIKNKLLVTHEIEKSQKRYFKTCNLKFQSIDFWSYILRCPFRRCKDQSLTSNFGSIGSLASNSTYLNQWSGKTPFSLLLNWIIWFVSF